MKFITRGGSLFFLLYLLSSVSVDTFCQTIIWQEDFNSYPNQTTQNPGFWTTVANDSDDPCVNCGTNYWGTYNGRFRCNDIEGYGNNDQNFLTTVKFDVSSFATVVLQGDYQHSANSDPCSSGPAGRDIIHFQYKLDNDPWTTFTENGYICGDDQIPGTASSLCLEVVSVDSIAIRVQMANKANNENIYIDNLKIIGFGESNYFSPPTDTSFCNSNGVILQAGNAVNYSWQGADSISCDTCASVLIFTQNPDTVYLTAVDSAGCIYNDTTFINVFIPNLQLGPDTSICPSTSFTLNAQQPFAINYAWSTGSSSNSITINDSGSYSVTVQTQCGIVSDTLNVGLDQAPISRLMSDTTICSDTISITLDAGIGTTYNWNNGDTNRYQIINSAGVYWASISTSCGTIADTVQISKLDSPLVHLSSDTTICENETLNLNAHSNNSASYLWNTGNTDSIQSVITSGEYIVTVSNKCGSSSDSVSVTIIPLPQLTLEDKESFCNNDPILMDAQNQGAEYYWSTGETSQQIEISESGNYYVEVSYCNTTIYEEFNISFEGAIDSVFIPNVFTPNGDGINDSYEVVFVGNGFSLQEYSMEVINRWGKPVFSTNDPESKWEANHENEGTYFVIITYQDACTTEPTTIKNSITLLK